MKRAAAFVLSLTLIWLQTTAFAVARSTPAAESGCDCCVQSEVCRCCCVAPGEPDNRPLPAIPVSSGTTFDLTALAPKHIAWLLPANPLPTVSSTDSSVLPFAVPLFQRDCALLV